MKVILVPLLAAFAALALLMAGLGIKMLCGRSRGYEHTCQHGNGHCDHCTCK